MPALLILNELNQERRAPIRNPCAARECTILSRPAIGWTRYRHRFRAALWATLVRLVGSIAKSITSHSNRSFLFQLAMVRLRDLTLSAREMDPVKKTKLLLGKLMINLTEAGRC